MKSESSAGMINAAGKAYGDIIREYRRKKKMSQEELGHIANVRKNAVGAWEAGRSRPDIASIPGLCDALDLPLNVFFGLSQDTYEEELSRKFHRLSEYNQNIVLHEMDMLYDLQSPKKKKISAVKLFRLFMNDVSAAAGYSYGLAESSGELVYLKSDSVTEQADEIVRVSGDSMEPTFHDGDRVFIKHHVSIQPGDIGIFVNGDAGYIKEYRSDGLHSHNPAYPVIRFSENDDVKCVGKVIGKLKKNQFASEEEIAAYNSTGGMG